ncbi:L-lysine 6-transaminase [Candidatus Riflebacteria bacterium]
MNFIAPENVHSILGKYMLVDGFKTVADLEKSKGSYIFDSRDNRFILDFYTNFASGPLGFNHPGLCGDEFVKKLGKAAINKVANSDLYSKEFAEFVEIFARYTMPDSMKYLFFISGGALGIENAFKASFDWKIRKTGNENLSCSIMHLREAFHGRTGYTLSVTNTADTNKTKYFTKFTWPRITNPKINFPLDEKENQRVAEVEKRAFKEIAEACEKHGDEIAAFIMEPIQGEGGDNHFRKEFFQGVRELADKYDFMLIFDEVQTGIGLTGKMWGYQHFGVEPDMLCFGKKTQVCGFYCGPRIDEVENHVFKVSGRINSTWGGNLVDMVRSQRIQEIIAEENLIENATKIGELLLEQLIKLNEKKRVLSNIRGRGLFIAFDCPTKGFRDILIRNLLEKGLKVLPSGEKSIRLRPPLNLKEEEVFEAIKLMDRCL